MSTLSPSRGRGRPRTYDEDAALDAALKVFWTRGFGATSLDDLTAAMQMSRPSVYAAFGNKQAIYDAALEHFTATIASTYIRPLVKNAGLRESLAGFYSAVIDAVTGRHGPLGCIVACTLPAEAGHSREARDQLAGILEQLDRRMEERLRAAKKAGELAKDADIAALTQVVSSGMLALSIRARSGMSRSRLSRIARSFVDLVAPANASQSRRLRRKGDTQ